MMTSHAALALLVGAGCLACAAGSRAGGTSAIEPAASAAQQLTLDVRNDAPSDATVFALSGGNRQRLGFVSAQNSDRFVFNWGQPSVRFQIDLIGGGSMLTDEIVVHRGDQLEVVIDNHGLQRFGRW